MTTTLEAIATRMTIYLNDGDRRGHKALFSEIGRRGYEHGLARASVLHVVEGYGVVGFLHAE